MLLVVEYLIRHGLNDLIPEYSLPEPIPEPRFDLIRAYPPIGSLWSLFLHLHRENLLLTPWLMRYVIDPPVNSMTFWLSTSLCRDDVVLQQGEVFRSVPHLEPTWHRWNSTPDWFITETGNISTW